MHPMAKIWYLSPQSRTLREERSIAWCVDKLWISPRDFRSSTPPQNLKGEAVWIEITETEVARAPGYKPGFHYSYLTPKEVEERLKKI